jgi:hypothetical protein
LLIRKGKHRTSAIQRGGTSWWKQSKRKKNSATRMKHKGYVSREQQEIVFRSIKTTGKKLHFQKVARSEKHEILLAVILSPAYTTWVCDRHCLLLIVSLL